MKMMKSLMSYAFSIATVFVFNNGLLYAQESRKEMTYTIKAIANETPTAYVLTLPMTFVGATVEEADMKTKTAMKTFTKDLQSLQADQIHTEFVKIQPIYKKYYEKSKKSNEADIEIGEERIGYEYRQNVRILYTQNDQLAKIMLAAAKHGIYDIGNIEYRYNKGEKTFATLRAKCIDYMRQYLPQLEDQGFDILDWQRYTEEERLVFYPQDKTKKMTLEQVTTQLYTTPEKTTINLHNRQNTEHTISQRIGVEDFNIVINPDLLEPAIQLVYIFKIKMVVPAEQQKVEFKNEFTFPPRANNTPSYLIPFVPQE